MSPLLAHAERFANLRPREPEAASGFNLVASQELKGFANGTEIAQSRATRRVHDVAGGILDFSELLDDVHASRIPDDRQDRQEYLTSELRLPRLGVEE